MKETKFGSKEWERWHTDQGENPDLSQEDIWKIREQKPGIIYNGSRVGRCNVCGHPVAPNGACEICINCGCSTGVCG